VQPWCRVTITDADGRVLARRTLSGTAAPGLDAVDEVARLALLAVRMGAAVTLADVSPDLRELLDLAGLGNETAGLRVKVEWQAEGGEQALVVEEGEEEVHRRDPPA